MPKSPHESAEKLYQQLLDLLEELTALYTESSTSTVDEEEPDEEEFNEAEMIEGLIEDGVERGLDDVTTAQAFKAVEVCARKSAGG